MNMRWARWMVLAAISPLVFDSASRKDTISHGPPREPSNSTPEGSQPICPGVPTDVALIPQLKSDFAIDSPSSSSIQLLFSDQVLSCKKLGSVGISHIAQETCGSAWHFSLDIPSELQQPDLYVLSNHQAGY